MAHAAKVRDTAMALFEQVADEWQLRPHARLLAYGATFTWDRGTLIQSPANTVAISSATVTYPGLGEALQLDFSAAYHQPQKKPNELMLAELWSQP